MPDFREPSQITFDPQHNKYLTLPGIKFDSISADGAVGGTGIGFVSGTLQSTVVVFQTVANQPLKPEEEGVVTRIFGTPPELASVGYAPPGLVVGLRGTADRTGITQLGVILEKRPLSFTEPASSHRLLRLWPKVSFTTVPPGPVSVSLGYVCFLLIPARARKFTRFCAYQAGACSVCAGVLNRSGRSGEVFANPSPSPCAHPLQRWNHRGARQNCGRGAVAVQGSVHCRRAVHVPGRVPVPCPRVRPRAESPSTIDLQGLPASLACLRFQVLFSTPSRLCAQMLSDRIHALFIDRSVSSSLIPRPSRWWHWAREAGRFHPPMATGSTA